MQKLLIILFSSLVSIGIVVGTLVLFLFSEQGNRLLQPYLEARLQKHSDKPLKIEAFRMHLHEVNLTLLWDEKLRLEAMSDEGVGLLKHLFLKHQPIEFKGSSSSLGGEIAYKFEKDVFYILLENVPVENILPLLGHKAYFLGRTFGKGWYDTRQKKGVVSVEIEAFQIKPTQVTQSIKRLLGTDITRIVFSKAHIDATIDKKITTYTLYATGDESAMTIEDGIINKTTNNHDAKFTLYYQKYTLHGKIEGSIDDPDVTFDTKALFEEQLSQETIKKSLDKAENFLKALGF